MKNGMFENLNAISFNFLPFKTVGKLIIPDKEEIKLNKSTKC
jgi:hypothetical protein